MILVPVAADDVNLWWHRIDPFARQMADRWADDWPTDETLRQARSGMLRLWLAYDEGSKSFVAAAGTKLVLKPSGRKAMIIRWCAGMDAERFVSVLPGIEADAKAQGCDLIEIDPGSRAGWARLLPGYRARPSVMLTKELIP